MHVEPEISGCSIVLVGCFNPAIIHPAWLAAKGIHPEANETTVDLQIVHNDISNFTIDTVSYFVQVNRFQIETSSGPWIKIADTTRAIFGEHLFHTPVHAFGINRSVQFRLSSHEARHRLGRRLAPIEPWGTFGKQLETDDPQLMGGMIDLEMMRKERIQGARVRTSVKIQPSMRSPNDGSEIYMHLNSHHEILDLPNGHGCETALKLIGNRFEAITIEADNIFGWIKTEGSK